MPELTIDNSQQIALLKKAASYYTSQGIAIVPISPNSKVPILKNWTKLPFQSDNDIITWYGKKANNLGIRTGSISRNLFVLDIDNGTGGYTSLQVIESLYGDLPSSVRVETPSGGKHLYLMTPEGFPVPRNSQSLLAVGLDIRGEGGQVLAPPSMTAQGRYVLHDDEGDFIDLNKVAQAPPWFMELIARSNKKNPLKGIAQPIQSPSKPNLVLAGARHSTMVSLVGSLRAKGLTDDAIQAACVEENKLRFVPPMPIAELTTICQSTQEWSAEPAYTTQWQDDLQKGKDGMLLGTATNTLLFLRNDLRLAPLFRLNLMSSAIEIHGVPPWGDMTKFTHETMGPPLMVELRAWLASQQKFGYRMREVQHTALYDALHCHASKYSYHPVHEYLDQLVWDETPRIDHFFSDHCSTEHSPLASWCAVVLFLGAVARVKHPGCIHRLVPILIGPELIGKSTLVRRLTLERWSGTLSRDLASNDSIMQLGRHWLIELSELDSLKRTRELSTIKDFISRTEDTYRPPYGHIGSICTRPRSCVFVGTCNDETPLVEGEDNTRWIPLRIGTIDHDALTDDTLHQLWGEAVVREGRGEHWWIPSREAKTQWQGAREETTSADPWTDAVLAYMAIAAPTPGGYSPSGALEHVTLSEIWEKAFSSTQTTDLTRLTRREEMRIANILKRHDFKKVYRGVGKRLWGYIRK